MKIESNFELQQYNTFGLASCARYFTELVTVKDVYELVEHEWFGKIKHQWLGGGSNIIMAPFVDAWVLHVANKGIEILSETDEKVLIRAQAGESWHQFVLHCVSLGYSGLENLSLIPGQVGSAPVQNIGAYGVEVKDIIHSVECFDTHEKKWRVFSNAECQFQYRDSFFKHAEHGRYLIWSVILELNKVFKPNMGYGDLEKVATAMAQGSQMTAKIVSDAVCQIRLSKLPDPKIMGNVGSFFHNPILTEKKAKLLKQQHPSMPQYAQNNKRVKIAAGWLIDQAGLKGLQQGGAAVHQQQALVLVNKGKATHQNILDLAKQIQNLVLDKFDVDLHIEPTFW